MPNIQLHENFKRNSGKGSFRSNLNDLVQDLLSSTYITQLFPHLKNQGDSTPISLRIN